MSDLTYMAKLDLGGWVPSSLLQIIAQKEWPKALNSICKAATELVLKEGKQNIEFFVDCDL